jgi:uncharacterized protein YacL
MTDPGHHQTEQDGTHAAGGPREIHPDHASDPAVRRPTRIRNPVEAAARQRDLLLRVVRGSFVVLIVTVTLLNVLQFGEGLKPGLTFDLAAQWWLPLTLSCAGAAVFLAVDVLTPNKKLQTFGGIIFGLVAGLIVTIAVGFVIDLIATSWDFAGNAPIVNTIKVLLGISLCYLGISTVLQTQDDFRLVIPYVEFAKQLRGQRPMLLDTSSVIDARIADVGETGILQAPVIIPFFVVDELQTLADSGDKLKRAKGRRGLDVVSRLQRSATMDVTIDETPVPGKAVDQMLVELAVQVQGMIVTGDVALARIAGFRNVPVLNVNELANALKPSLVPGETLTVHLIKAGEQPGQAVGYLEDGTMIVAEDGGDAIGTEATLEVRSSLQTAAGRMIFGRINDEHDARAADGTPEPTGGGAEPGPPGPRRNGAGQPSPDEPETGAPRRAPTRKKSPRNPRR